MNDVLEKAIAKVDAEIEKAKGNRIIEVIGEYLINLVTNNPETAEKLLNGKKSLQGAYKALEAEARKKQSGNCAVLTDEEGFEIVCRYYGVAYKGRVTIARQQPAAQQAPALDVDLDDLLG